MRKMLWTILLASVLGVDTTLGYFIVSDMISNHVWTKIKREHGLYRYNPTGQYFARVRFKGKLYRRKLDSADLALAKRKLRAFKGDLERTDATKGNTSFAKVLDDYAATLTGAAQTIKDKRTIIGKLKQTWFGASSLPLRTVKPSQLTAWLSKHYGQLSASAYNAALSVIRSALDMAVADKIILESPASGLTYRKREKPIRPTPTFEEFRSIVADIRAQRLNREAEQSADFVEFLGMAGLGQAEVASIKRSDVDLEAGRIITYRHKTKQGFAVPIYPQLRPLIEKLCNGKAHDQRLFTHKDAAKALSNACRRLGLPPYSHRALRRMFITRAIERGVDVKVIAEWQGHKDGGKLILQTYSHVRPVHSHRMAQLMSTDEPDNVVPMQSQILS
jgi:integrase